MPESTQSQATQSQATQFAAVPQQSLRIATRKSPLALAQAGTVARALAASTGRATIIVPVSTFGDVATGPLASIGGAGVFAGAVREAVLAGDADVGVHSLKDLPTAAYPGLILAAVPLRGDPRDVLCAQGDGRVELADLPANARVGTGSPRRASQLRNRRADLNVMDVRGNVDTRLGKVSSGELDAVVLAYAGLARLDRLDFVSSVLDPDVMMPAPAQGALAIETRDDIAEEDPQLYLAISMLDDADTRSAVTSERAMLAQLGAGCSSPVGALALVSISADEEPTINLRAVVATVDGTQVFRKSISGSAHAPDKLGRQLADDLLAAGAADLMGESSS